MAEKFDPYRKWLGIPPEEQPPHHYRLLGIAPFEDDTDVITYAADRQMSHVRKFQAGQNGHFSQQILNELSKARLCLLDRGQKIAYDQELQKKIGGERQLRSAPVAAPRKAPSSAPVPAPPQAAPPVSSVATMEPPVGSAMAPVAIPVAGQTIEAPGAIGARPTRTATSRIRRKSSPLPLVLGICGLAVVAALAAVVAIVSSSDFADGDEAGSGETDTAVVHNVPNTNVTISRPRPDRIKPDRPTRKPPRNADDANGDGQPDKLIIPDNPDNHVDGEGSLPPITREPSDTDPATNPDGNATDPVMDPLEPADDSPKPDEPKVTDTEDDPPAAEDPPAATGEDANEEPLVDDPERTAKFTAAVVAANEAFTRRDLKEAARQIAAARQVKQGRDEEQQVVFLAELQQHLGAFWRLAATGTRKLKTGDEISFASHTATFDHAEDGDVTLMVDGERKSRPLEDVEMHFLIALAERGAAKPDNKSRLAIATFLALDVGATAADRDTARKLLAEVLAEGGRSPVLEALLAEAPPR